MKFKALFVAFAAVSMISFAGCKVDKTKEGGADIDVPEYDVKPADVDVGTRKTTMTVPTVDVNMPPDDNSTPAPRNPD